MGAMASDPLQSGWGALRAFFSEGMPALRHALAAFERAERGARAAGDPQPLVLWLLGTATALRYTRMPEPMEAALERARELVNLTVRTQGEAASIPYRAQVGAISHDLAGVIPSQAAAYLGSGLAYSERTLRLARKAKRDDWLAAAAASRADLLARHASIADDGRAIRRALALHEDARAKWPGRDPYGRAQATIGYGEALLTARQPARTELVVRETLPIFTAHNDRYHEAAARTTLARALGALEQAEALEQQEAAVSLYKMLGCRWELAHAEQAL